MAIIDFQFPTLTTKGWAVALVADAKLDFQRKQAHWKELNKQYQFLCNQNQIIKKDVK